MPDEQAEGVFPLHELAIATVLILAIGTGLYFLAGAWGTALLWGYAVLFAMPWVAAVIGQCFVVAAKMAERDWKGLAVNGTGLIVMSAAWLALMIFFGYRAYLAIP